MPDFRQISRSAGADRDRSVDGGVERLDGQDVAASYHVGMSGSAERADSILLENRECSLTVEKPGQRYRGSRFDWNGLVSQVRFRGVTLLGQEDLRRQSDMAILGRGLHNEFGIKKCIGYDDCAIGEWFPKIGTGWLKKDEKPYLFSTEYPMEELSFDCEVSGKSEVRFTCESGERDGYAYRYMKKITLEDSGFTIRYDLENLGSKPLETDEYVHNFLCIGKRRMDVGYSLSFPWKIDTASLVKVRNPDQVLSIVDNRIDVLGQTDKQFYFDGLSEGVTESDGLAANWTLSDSESKIRLSERGSFSPSGVHVWGSSSVISPGLFFEFSIEPGNTTTWDRSYALSSLSA